MSAAIISIGDEIVCGGVQDSNFAFLANRLGRLGISVQEYVVIGDEPLRLSLAIKRLCDICKLILLTGGLGPTPDDVTRYAISDALGVSLEMDAGALAKIEEYFARIKRSMSKLNQVQAMIPAGSEVIENSCGTAPGIAAKLGQAHIFALPGVPHEMRAMFNEQVEPRLRQLGLAKEVLASRKLHCCGLGESNIADLIKDFMEPTANPRLGITANDGIISIILSARFASAEAAEKLLDEKSRQIRARLGEHLFGQDEQTLGQAVGKLLVEANHRLALAESCTGGLIGKLLTDLPGASRFLLADLVTYANSAKVELLSVAEELLNQYGAVSSQCARAMASGAIERTGADWGLSITGIAGPEGGTDDKPIGLVYIGLTRKGPSGKAVGVDVRKCHFRGDREHIRLRASYAALDLLRRVLLEKR